MGVPGPVTSAASAGVHQLFRERARPAGHPGEEVLEAVAPAGQHTLVPAREDRAPRDLLTPEQHQVLDAVPVQPRRGRCERIAPTRGPGRAQRCPRALTDLAAAGASSSRCAGRWRLVVRPAEASPAAPAARACADPTRASGFAG